MKERGEAEADICIITDTKEANRMGLCFFISVYTIRSGRVQVMGLIAVASAALIVHI